MVRLIPRRRAALFATLLGSTGCVDDSIVTNPAKVGSAEDGAAAAAKAAKIRACVEDLGRGLNLADSGPPVSFRADVMPLLVTRCNVGGCHDGLSSGFPPGFGNTCWFDPVTVTCSVDGAALTEEVATAVHANLLAQSVSAPGLRRVEPGRVDRSFLLMKLSGCQNAFPLATGCANCGSEMPVNGTLRDSDPASFDLVARWVQAGAGLD